MARPCRPIISASTGSFYVPARNWLRLGGKPKVLTAARSGCK